MRTLPNMVSMLKTDEEKREDCMPCAVNAPDYPYGLCISLTQNELDKLGLTHDDFCIDDIVHLHALGVVTSVSSNQTSSGLNCRVEIQITNIEAEDEDEENAEKEDTLSKLYK